MLCPLRRRSRPIGVYTMVQFQYICYSLCGFLFSFSHLKLSSDKLNSHDYPLSASVFAMISIDMNAIEFYKGPQDDARFSTPNVGVPSVNLFAQRSCSKSGGSLADHDVVEVPDLTDGPLEEPCLVFYKRH